MSGYLLDTNALLRWADANDLGPVATAAVESATRLVVSDISMWELAIKTRRGKIRLSQPVDVWFDRTLAQRAISSLAIARRHIARVASLPLHHNDPFDRLLIAQAEVEGLTVVTTDREFRQYGIDVLSAHR